MIGRPSIFRSQTCDKLDPSGRFFPMPDSPVVSLSTALSTIFIWLVGFSGRTPQSRLLCRAELQPFSQTCASTMTETTLSVVWSFMAGELLICIVLG